MKVSSVAVFSSFNKPTQQKYRHTVCEKVFISVLNKIVFYVLMYDRFLFPFEF